MAPLEQLEGKSITSAMMEGNSEETDYRFHHLIYETWKNRPSIKDGYVSERQSGTKNWIWLLRSLELSVNPQQLCRALPLDGPVVFGIEQLRFKFLHDRWISTYDIYQFHPCGQECLFAEKCIKCCPAGARYRHLAWSAGLICWWTYVNYTMSHQRPCD